LSQLTLQQGVIAGPGGCMLIEQAEVQLNDVKIMNCEAIFDASVVSSGSGGGIRARASTLRIYNSEISDNVASNGAGIAISNGGMEIRNSLIVANQAGFVGGGINLSSNGQFTIFESAFSNNSAVRLGGAVYIDGSIGFGTNLTNVQITKSTFNTNLSNRDGGGLYISGEVDIQFTNSTVSGNTAQDSGGGIGAFAAENIRLINTTVFGNSARFGGGLDSSVDSRVFISNSIVSGNTASAQGAEIYRSGSSEVNYLGNNLLGNSSLSTEQSFWNPTLNNGVINATSNGNRPTALLSILRPLADNGGNTFTHSLVENSPAIDAGSLSVCRGSVLAGADQRGVTHQGTCDLGSFEFGSLAPASPTPPDSGPINAGSAIPAILILLSEED